MKKKIIILTESNKNGGYCVAGIDEATGYWVRLITEDIESNGALSSTNLRYKDGTYCEVLDCVEVNILKNGASQIQPENLVIDSHDKFEKVREYTLDDVLKKHPAEISNEILGNIWANIKADDVDSVNKSLTLIYATNLYFHNEINNMGRTVRKLDFTYNCRRYSNFSITDYSYSNINSSTNDLDSALLVISLPELCYNKYHYKCVSQIFVYKMNANRLF